MRLNEWGFALKQTLQGQLEAGSFGAIGVVFAAGVLTSLTPCVYPMIPVTVAVFGGQRASRARAAGLALLYVAGIALTYATLGVWAAATGRLFGSALADPRVDSLVVVTDGAPTGGAHWNLDLMFELLVWETRWRPVAVDAVLVDASARLREHWAGLAERTGGTCTSVEFGESEAGER